MAKMATKTINVPAFGIIVELYGEKDNGTFLKGTITSNMKEVCPYCSHVGCNMGCPEFTEYCTDKDPNEALRKQQEQMDFQITNAFIDAVESLILAHAVAGMTVDSPAYVEGIEAVVDKIGNKT